jgi:hypothetical protein
MKNAGTALDGSKWMAVTPTPGTGIKVCIDAATAIVATAPSILIVNTDAVGGKAIILDALRLVVRGAGAGLTTLNISTYIDVISRFTSGGSKITPISPNSGVTAGSIAAFYDASTAIVAPAASGGVRRVGTLMPRTAIPVVGDHILVEFGGLGGLSGSVTNGTAALTLLFQHAPVVIQPGHSFLLYVWAASMSTAPSFEYDVEWIEAG